MIVQNINLASYFPFIMNCMAETVEYSSWSNEYKQREIEKCFNIVRDVFKRINLNKLTEDELKLLGFRKYNSSTENYLIPLWLLRVLPDGTKVRSIMGEEFIIGVDYDVLDNDTRYGMTAYELVQEQK